MFFFFSFTMDFEKNRKLFQPYHFVSLQLKFFIEHFFNVKLIYNCFAC